MVTDDLAKEILSRLDSLGTALRVEINALRGEMRDEIGKVRAELTAEIGKVRAELTEVRAELTEVRADVAQLRSEFTGLGRWFETLAGNVSQIQSQLVTLSEDVHDMRELMAHLQADMRVQRTALGQVIQRVEVLERARPV